MYVYVYIYMIQYNQYIYMYNNFKHKKRWFSAPTDIWSVHLKYTKINTSSYLMRFLYTITRAKRFVVNMFAHPKPVNVVNVVSIIWLYLSTKFLLVVWRFYIWFRYKYKYIYISNLTCLKPSTVFINYCDAIISYTGYRRTVWGNSYCRYLCEDFRI